MKPSHDGPSFFCAVGQGRAALRPSLQLATRSVPCRHRRRPPRHLSPLAKAFQVTACAALAAGGALGALAGSLLWGVGSARRWRWRWPGRPLSAVARAGRARGRRDPSRLGSARRLEWSREIGGCHGEAGCGAGRCPSLATPDKRRELEGGGRTEGQERRRAEPSPAGRQPRTAATQASLSPRAGPSPPPSAASRSSCRDARRRAWPQPPRAARASLRVPAPKRDLRTRALGCASYMAPAPSLGERRLPGLGGSRAAMGTLCASGKAALGAWRPPPPQVGHLGFSSKTKTHNEVDDAQMMIPGQRWNLPTRGGGESAGKPGKASLEGWFFLTPLEGPDLPRSSPFHPPGCCGPSWSLPG